jgi:cytoskeletal protein CcmA (bactofilin family)
MALWNDNKDAAASATGTTARTNPVTDLNARAADKAAEPASGDAARRPAARGQSQESLLAAELIVEGRIEGGGNVRLAGRFKGDIQVSGSVYIESGAHVEGSIHAPTVVVAGELTGNIDKAKQVDVMQTGVVIGDVKAGTLTVAAGARVRGSVEFGWADSEAARPVSSMKVSS